MKKSTYFEWFYINVIIGLLVAFFIELYSQNKINMPDPVLKHSYTFENGTANDVVGEAHGIIKGDGEIINGLFITDEQGEYIELPAHEIKINEYSAITLEAYVMAGKGNGEFTMLSYFGNTLNNKGVDYLFQTIENWKTSGTSITCKNYTTKPWETSDTMIGLPLHDDQFHHIVTTFNDDELKFYIDGRLIGGRTLENKDNIIKNLSNAFAYLCKSGYLQDQTWLGAIDTFNIYEGVLDAKTIANSAKRLDYFEKKFYKLLEDNNKNKTLKPVLKHSYTFDDGTPNDIISGANGIIIRNGEIKDGLFITDEPGEYMVLPAYKIKINEYSAITLEAYVLVAKGNFDLTLSYFGHNRVSRGIDYFAQWVQNNESSWSGISCNITIRPWEIRTDVGGISIQDYKFHHVVTTFDNQVLKYYVDGVLMNTQFNLRQKSNAIGNLSNEQAYLCKSGNRWEQTMHGSIDAFNIYEGVLDAKTIANTAKEYLKASKGKEQQK